MAGNAPSKTTCLRPSWGGQPTVEEFPGAWFSCRGCLALAFTSVGFLPHRRPLGDAWPGGLREARADLPGPALFRPRAVDHRLRLQALNWYSWGEGPASRSRPQRRPARMPAWAVQTNLGQWPRTPARSQRAPDHHLRPGPDGVAAVGCALVAPPTPHCLGGVSAPGGCPGPPPGAGPAGRTDSPRKQPMNMFALGLAAR